MKTTNKKFKISKNFTLEELITKESSIFEKLYDYQLNCVDASDKANNGIFCLPTGTGKTLIQASIIAKDILDNAGKFGMYVINSPRIMLSYQLMKEVYTFLMDSGIDARYMSVHSGGQDDIEDLEKIRLLANEGNGKDIKFAQTENSTSVSQIKEMIEKTRKQKLPLVFVSTYNSAERIEQARKNFRDKIRVVVNDESHYLVQEQFHSILSILKTNRCYSFTATLLNTPSVLGRGMNNVDAYGELIYKMTPREAIDRGKMVRPRMHFVITKDKYNNDDFQSSLGHIIEESFLQHSYALGLNAKMLVSVKGVGDIKRFFDSKEYSKLIQLGIDIYAVASDDQIGNNINGEKMSRMEFLKRLKNAGTDRTKRLIVLHYDILAEGIDVSGFTGVLLLRSLEKLKFLQTYGRIARLDSVDRASLEAMLFGPNDLDKFNKPYAWVIIPSIIHEHLDNKDYIGNIITELRDYGFDPTQDIVCSSGINGLPVLKGPEGLNQIKKKCPNIGEYIEKVEADYENERFASLSEEERFIEINGLDPELLKSL